MAQPARQSARPSRHEHLDIPDLRILPVEALVLHEHADEKRVARLAARLRTDGYLKNPPIVAPMPGSDRYVVLDGANRTSAVQLMGCPHVVAQVVEYAPPHVQLTTWYHLIAGREPKTFLEEIRAVKGLKAQPVPFTLARTMLASRSILSYLVLPPREDRSKSEVYMLGDTEGDNQQGLQNSTVLLNAMVDTYKSDPQVAIHRVNTDELDELMDYYDDVSGLVVFPPYSPEDILKLAEAGTKVPTGITRHIISHRALRINIPTNMLSSSDSLEEKNAWLHEQLKRKLAANEIRLYQESTYLFDE